MVEIRLAGPGDDPALRASLRRNGMRGAVSVAFEAEPSFFDALSVQGRTQQVVLGMDGAEVVGFGVRATRDAFVNGQVERIGYLSGLRVETAYRSRVFLARGFRLFRELDRADAVPFYITTIVGDNRQALRTLEGRRAGLPEYRYVDDIRTFVLAPQRRAGPRLPVEAAGARLEEAMAFLHAQGRSKQCFPWFSASDFGTAHLRGLRPGDVRIALDGGTIVGVIARWDQSAFKQTRVVAYDGVLRVARPVNNLARFVTHVPRLPAAGERLRYLHLSFPCVAGNEPEHLRAMLRAELGDPHLRAYDAAVLALAARDPLCRALDAFAFREYRSRLYTVSYGAHPDLAGIPFVEAATL